MSNQENPQPSIPHERIDDWITAQLDAERVVRTGQSWRRKVLKQRSLGDCMTDIPHRQMVRVPIHTDEWVLVTNEIRRLGLNKVSFIRMCIGQWMLDHTEIKRETLRQLTRDVP